MSNDDLYKEIQALYKRVTELEAFVKKLGFNPPTGPLAKKV